MLSHFPHFCNKLLDRNSLREERFFSGSEEISEKFDQAEQGRHDSESLAEALSLEVGPGDLFMWL